jgi:tetratricopeptide (TPR) repeat protein
VEDALRRAKIALDQGRAAEAEQATRAILREDERNAAACQLLGGALLLQRRFEDAVEPLERAARTMRDPQLDTQLAIALRNSGRNEDALSRLRRAIKRQPPYALAFYELGVSLVSMKQYDEAIAAIHSGIAIAPFLPNLWVLLGNICHARNDLPGAYEAYDRALSISPNHANAHYGVGVSLLSQGSYALAVDHLRAASRGDPNDVQTRLRLAACLLEVGRTDEAVAELRAAIRGGPEHVYTMSLNLVLRSGRGRFWLRPSEAARKLK